MAQGYGLIEKLQFALLTGGAAYPGSQLPGPQAVEPEPAKKQQAEDGEQVIHGRIVTAGPGDLGMGGAELG